ncbi:hypothetical protein ACQJBY_015448 [Aegilops geniculata]
MPGSSAVWPHTRAAFLHHPADQAHPGGQPGLLPAVAWRQGGAAAPRASLVAARTVQTNRQQAHGRSSAAEAGTGNELRKPPAGGDGGAAGIRGSAPYPQSVPSESRRSRRTY